MARFSWVNLLLIACLFVLILSKVLSFSWISRTDDNVLSSVGLTFKDYEFNVEDLPPFTRFQIKIDMVGTNQAQPPYIKDLRAIALA